MTQLSIVGTSGLPQHSVMSLRCGATRRQQPLPLKAPLVFQKVPPAGPYHLEIYEKMAWSRARSGLGKIGEDGCFTMRLESSRGDHVTLTLRKVDGRTDLRRTKPWEEEPVEEKLSGVDEYLARHKVNAFMKGVFQEVMRVMPEDPYAFIAARIQERAQAENPPPAPTKKSKARRLVAANVDAKAGETNAANMAAKSAAPPILGAGRRPQKREMLEGYTEEVWEDFPDPVRFPSPRDFQFSVARRGTYNKGELLYSVEMTQVVKGTIKQHRSNAAPKDYLRAIVVDTGTCRLWNKTLKAPEATFHVEWHAWQKWHPEAEREMRDSVPVFGLPWHLSRQVGVLDGLLFSQDEPSLVPEEPNGSNSKAAKKRPSQEEIISCITERAKFFGLSQVSVKAVQGGFLVQTAESTIMPDPCEAPREKLEEFLAPLLKENPEEEEACLNIARWRYALQQRKEYLAKLPRPQCWADLPFYSLVTPLSRRRTGFVDEPCSEPAQPTNPEELSRVLSEASQPLAGNSSFDAQLDAEAARMGELKKVKWSVDLPLRLWSFLPNEEEEGMWVQWQKLEIDALRKDIYSEEEPHLDFVVPPEIPTEGPTLTCSAVDLYEAWQSTLRHLDEQLDPFVFEVEPLPMAESDTLTCEPGDLEAWQNSLRTTEESPKGAVPWDETFIEASPGWEGLPDKAIANDQEQQDPKCFWEWTKKKRARRKFRGEALPEHWNNILEVPEGYTAEVAREQTRARWAAIKEEVSKAIVELAAEGEKLVQWPKDRAWPQTKPETKFLEMVERLRAMDAVRTRGSAASREERNLAEAALAPRKKEKERSFQASNPLDRQKLIDRNLKEQEKTGFNEGKSALGQQVLSKRLHRMETQPVWTMEGRRPFSWTFFRSPADLFFQGRSPDSSSPGPGMYNAARSCLGRQVEGNIIYPRESRPMYSLLGRGNFNWTSPIRQKSSFPGPGSYR